jgi:hypothetical protein
VDCPHLHLAEFTTVFFNLGVVSGLDYTLHYDASRKNEEGIYISSNPLKRFNGARDFVFDVLKMGRHREEAGTQGEEGLVAWDFISEPILMM